MDGERCKRSIRPTQANGTRSCKINNTHTRIPLQARVTAVAEFPAFPLWTDAYLADTTELTTQEHGAYFLLLIAMWRAGGYVPDDDAKLARFTRLTLRQWTAVRQSLSEFLTIENGSVTQGRLLDELEKARGRSKKAAESARAKYRKTNKLNGANAGSEQCSEDASTSISITIKETPTVPKGTRGVKKVDDKLYHEFEEMVWKEFPRHPNSRKDPAFKKYQDLPSELRAKCIGGVARYANRFEETVDPKRTAEERLNFVPHLVTWINQRGWESEYERML